MEVHSRAKRVKRLNILTTGVAILITFILLVAYQYVSGRRQLMDEFRAEARIIGANSSATLLFNDEKAAKEILAAIRLTPRIIGAALYLADGQLFAAENDARGVFPKSVGEFNPNNPQEAEVSPDRFASLLREEIYQDDSRVGTLLIHVSFKSLYWQLTGYAFSVVFIGAIALLLTQRFTTNLRKRMALTEEQLQHMALYDQVTGLPNRSFFEYELGKAITRIKRSGGAGALLFIDVDDFKKVNDLCGHEEGDRVLLMISERLKNAIRATDIVARVGGDEFAVILHGIVSPENAAKVASQMIAAMSEPFLTKPVPSHVGLSIGVAMVPGDSEDPTTLLRWSDMAMYVAKSLGMNRYQFFSEDINNQVRGKLQIEADLRDALKTGDGGLWVAYQPQVDAKTREIVGIEALMRWRLTDGTLISPGEFIPIAEKTGLVVDLGVWLIKRVCQDLALMRSHGVEFPKVAVNVSPRELTRGTGIVDGICKTLEDYGENLSRFQFELTENALMDENGAEVLDAFRNAGFSLAIDDFGSGYSSLGYLKRFHVSTLKIDQQFVRRLPGDTEDGAIVSAVIQMSKALGITVVAEGVETEAQADFLARNGCDTLQGFLLSRPIPPEELERYVKKH